MPDPMIEIAKIIDSQIESRLAKFKKDIQKYVDNRRVGTEQIEAGAIIVPKLSTSVNRHIQDTVAPALVELAERKTTIFYQTTEPSEKVTGDVWYDTDATPVAINRWDGDSWEDITSAALSSALSAAGDAQAVADGKIVTFAQTDSPTATSVGDLWIDTNDSNKLYRWSGTGWFSVQDGLIASHATAIAGLTTSLSGKTTIYYQISQPTATVTGDIWYDTDASPVTIKRWSGSAWVDITTDALSSALAAAADAQSTADGKIKTYAQTTAPTGMTASDVGDLWTDTDDNNKLYRYSGSAWVSVQDGLITSHSTAIAGLTSSLNSKTTIYYQTSSPASPITGDVWYDTDAVPVIIWRWSGSTWVDITTVALSNALAAANTAQATADGKVRTFAQTSAPTGMVASDVGDLWVDTNDNNKLYRWSGSAWIVVQDTHLDGTIDNWKYTGKTTIDGGKIETDTVKAVQIDVDNLFADAATINALKTSVITNISIGGNNLLKNSAFEFGMDSWEVMEWESTGTNKSCVVMDKGGTYEPGEANTLQFRATNETGMYGAHQYVSGLTKNTDYTFSGYVRQDRMTGNVVVNVIDNVDWANRVYTGFDAPTGTNTDSLSGYGRFSYTFNTGNHTSFRLAVWGENYGADGVIWLTRLQLEQGDVATEWRPSASEFKSSKINLSDSGVSIDAGVFAINVSGTNGDMSLDESGLSVAKVNSGSVTPRYTGAGWLEVNKSATDAQVQSGSHFRSLGDALKTVDGMYLDYGVRINLAPDTYYEGHIEAKGINGRDQLTIVGNGAVLNNTHLWFCGCGTLIDIAGVKMTRLTDSGQCISFRACKMARIADSVFTGTSKTDWSCAVLAEWGSSVLVEGCEAYNWQYSWMNNAASTIVANNCKGDCAVLCSNSTMIVNGTQPSPTSTYKYYNWGGLFQNNGATVDMGTATPPVPETATATFAATTMRTIHGTGEWSPTWLSAQNYTLQGYTSGGGRMYSALWFSGLSTLAGKTILSAKLTLRRILPTGRSGPAKVVAYYGALSNAAGSGAPSSRTSIGLLGSLENPQTGTFTIPTAAIAYLAGGATGRCLALNPSDSVLWNGKAYSENHARFAGVGSAYVPELTVTYQP